ncbi:MAG: pirin family protein [Acidobacteria bacterium]|nr:pirin family protein [Acidobacteriota bacterium]
MIQIRKSEDRGHANHGWLDTRHSFSFADYYDPDRVHFRGLRVINEDWVAGGKGFGMHPHRDMEILTWVRAGKLEHADTIGNRRTIEPGELQAMSAGSGLYHSEYNPSPDQPVHLFQIWIMPEKRGIQPGYDQKTFAAAGRQGKFQLVASGDGEDGSLQMNADARFLVADLGTGDRTTYAVEKGRGVYLQLASGSVVLNGLTLSAGDGAVVEDEDEITIQASSEAHLLLFDLK